MRVVFDTNVFISALLLPDSKPRAAVDLALSAGKILVSVAELDELSEVLSRRKFRRYVTDVDVRSFLAALARDAEWIEVNVQIEACRDPKDNMFLELAIAGRATHIVTGDDDLLALNPFRGISVLTPQQFLAAGSDAR